jgi:hypothetical protein
VDGTSRHRLRKLKPERRRKPAVRKSVEVLAQRIRNRFTFQNGPRIFEKFFSLRPLRVEAKTARKNDVGAEVYQDISTRQRLF